MGNEPRYKLDVVDTVLQRAGAARVITDDGSFVWSRLRDGHWHGYGVSPEDGLHTVSQGWLFAGCQRLGLDPNRILNEVQQRGGESLEP